MAPVSLELVNEIYEILDNVDRAWWDPLCQLTTFRVYGASVLMKLDSCWLSGQGSGTEIRQMCVSR